jgi:NAD(P)-dependent dehydrogenase (short-subunit alcohol dehydrogenase family)
MRSKTGKIMKTILITGANRGLGLEFARQFLARGDKVIACCRAPNEAVELQALNNDGLEILPLDVSNEEAIQSLPGRLSGILKESKIAIFINNAGIYGQTQSLDEVDPEEWLQVLRINTIAPLLLTRALLPLMDRQLPGKLMFLSSKMGSIADNGGGSTYIYRTSKTALNQVVKSLSIDLAAQGLLTAALHPGWVRTDMGGPNGLIDANESVAGMMRVIDALDATTSGHFFNFDGAEIPW